MLKHRFHRVVNAPRQVVFETLRDCQVELNDSLPNVATCRIVECRDMEDSRKRMVTEYNGQGSIPVFLKPILNPKKAVWKSHQLWDEENWWCDYFTEAVYFKNNVDVRGRWVFEENGAGLTDVRIRSVIRIDARGVPGMPPPLAPSVSTLVERMLHYMTGPNLDRVIRRLDAMIGDGA